MKIASILLSFIMLFLTACQSTQQQEMAGVEKIQDELVSLVRLSDEQMELAGVKTGHPETRTLSTPIECAAKVEVPPQSLALVYSPVSGFIQYVGHLPGEFVRKGTLLTTISHPNLVRLQREFLECHSQLSFLENDLQRKKEMAQSDATSQRSVEEAAAKLQLEQVRYKGLKSELELIGIDAKKLEQGGDIQSFIAINASISGFLTEVNVNRGKLIGPEDLLFGIVDDGHLHLELEVFAKDLPYIRKGQKIEARMPDSDRIIPAEVHLIGKVIDPVKKTAIVHGHFEKEPEMLTPGSYLQARVLTNETEALTLPESAVVRQGKEAFVFIKKEEGFERMAVATGRTGSGFVEIMGVSKDALIAVEGSYYLNGSLD